MSWNRWSRQQYWGGGNGGGAASNQQGWGGGAGGGQWWACTEPKCMALGKKWNKAGNTQCFHCMAPKGVGAIHSDAARQKLRDEVAAKYAKPAGGGGNGGAPKPPVIPQAVPGAAAAAAEEPKLTKAQRKAAGKLKAEKLLEEKIAAAIAQNNEAQWGEEFEVDASMEDCFSKLEAGVAETPTIEDAKRLTLLGLPLAPAAESKLLYQAPSGKDLPNPDLAVAKALEGEAAEAVAVLKAVVASLKESLRHLSSASGPDDDMVKQLAAQLVAKEEALAVCVKKADKFVKGDTLCKERYKNARSTITVAHAARAQRATKGAANAVKRFQADQKTLRDAVVELQKRIADGEQANAFTLKAWLDEEERILKHEAKVLSIFDAKASLAVHTGGLDQPEPGLVEDGAPAGAVKAAEPVKYAKKIEDDLQLRPNIDRGELAIIKKLDGATNEERTMLTDMYCFFESATFSGPLPPTMFSQTGGNVRMSKRIIGDVIWNKFYADRHVLEVDYIPLLMLDLMRYALRKAAAHFTEEKEGMDKATERLRVVRLNRPGPY